MKTLTRKSNEPCTQGTKHSVLCRPVCNTATGVAEKIRAFRRGCCGSTGHTAVFVLQLGVGQKFAVYRQITRTGRGFGRKNSNDPSRKIKFAKNANRWLTFAEFANTISSVKPPRSAEHPENQENPVYVSTASHPLAWSGFSFGDT